MQKGIKFKSLLHNLLREVKIRFPFEFQVKSDALWDKYIKSAKIRGSRIQVLNDLKIKGRNKIIYGSTVILKGGNHIDGTAGVLIGDDCLVDRNISIITRNENSFDPVVIGAGYEVKNDIKPGTILDPIISVQGLSEYGGQLVFILSTGRSGSKAIAKLLDQHDDAECYHDTFTHLNTWSCDFMYKKSGKEEIQKKLHSLYNSTSLGSRKVYGQSDQKLAPLVPILSEMFPEAKFIWLIRDPYDFVNSAYARGWFDNSEFGYEKNKNEFLNKRVTPSEFDAEHRCNGAKLGVFTEEEWKSMTAFERVCWYWSYWNSLIERNLNHISSKNSMVIKLEELENSKREVFEFIGLEANNVKAEKLNSAYYKKPDISQWTEEMKILFKKHCGSKMKEWGY